MLNDDQDLVGFEDAADVESDDDAYERKGMKKRLAPTGTAAQPDKKQKKGAAAKAKAKADGHAEDAGRDSGSQFKNFPSVTNQTLRRGTGIASRAAGRIEMQAARWAAPRVPDTAVPRATMRQPYLDSLLSYLPATDAATPWGPY